MPGTSVNQRTGIAFMKSYFELLFFLLVCLWLSGCSDQQQTATTALSPNARQQVTGVGIQAFTFDQTLFDNASFAWGGLLYDRWWVSDATGALNPTPPEIESSNHPLWPVFNNKRELSATWRCKACHGWDYMGRAGVYGKTGGNYDTNIKGLIPAENGDTPLFTTPEDIFSIIDVGSINNPDDHAFGNFMDVQALHAITKFVWTIQQEAAAGKSPSTVIDRNTKFVIGGDPNNGAQVYQLPAPVQGDLTVGQGGCGGADCHGDQGRVIDLDAPNRFFLDTYAWDNPWEGLHKIRFGDPGETPPMPGLEYYGNPQLDFQAAVDVLRYLQDGLIASSKNFDIQRYVASVDQMNKDFARGGILWDKWWVGTDETVVLSPPGNTEPHSLWPTINTTQTGDTTYRCKACHGWDYLGVAGVYGNPSSSYYTEIKSIVVTPDSVVPNLIAAQDIFDFLKAGEVNAPGDHAFNGILSDDDIYALTRFINVVQQEAFDGKSVAQFIQPWADIDPVLGYAKVIGGDSSKGLVHYNLLPFDPALADPETQGGCGGECHGEDGRLIGFDEDGVILYVADYAYKAPAELLHKIRFGHPGSDMLGFADYQISHLNLQVAVDVTAYSQGGLAREMAKGGRLFDNWMAEANLPSPTTRHALYDLQAIPDPVATDADTWRCALCHGWDYQGRAGLQNNLIALKLARNWEISEVYHTLKHGYVVLDAGQAIRVHQFGNWLQEVQLWSLAEFIMNGMVDTSNFIRRLGTAYLGDSTAGQAIYQGASLATVDGSAFDCLSCHGSDGQSVSSVNVFDTAWQNPWRFFHKVRFGAAGTPMPGVMDVIFTDNNHHGNNHDAVDILSFAQTQ